MDCILNHRHKCIKIVSLISAYKCRCGIKFICVLSHSLDLEKNLFDAAQTPQMCFVLYVQRATDRLIRPVLIKSDQNTGLCQMGSVWRTADESRRRLTWRHRSEQDTQANVLLSACASVTLRPWNDFTEDGFLYILVENHICHKYIIKMNII